MKRKLGWSLIIVEIIYFDIIFNYVKSYFGNGKMASS